MRKWVFVLTIALLILSPLYFWSFNVSAESGTVHLTLYPTADAYVNSSSSDTNYGSASSVYVSANAELDFIYVKFDLDSVPSDANILSASLDLLLVNTGGTIYGIPSDIIGAYYCSNNSWTEDGITWNNKPTPNASPTSTWSFSLFYTIGVYKSWAVAADVIAAVPSGNLTEVFKFSSKDGNGYAFFQSREATNKPKLEIEYSTAPALAGFALQFAANDVNVIYPSDSAQKPLGCVAAWVSDWTASAFVTTKLQSYTEGLDVNSNFVDQTSGRPVGVAGQGIISFGGPVVNPVVKRAESTSTASADRAPIKFYSDGGVFYFQHLDGTSITGATLPASVINNDQDMFVMEVYLDESGRYTMLCYGFGWKGTYAAGKYFHTVIYPDLASYNISWIIVKWQDTNGDGFVSNPGDGDTYTVIASST